MPNETPVTFQSNGRRMFGILHEPDGARREVPVLFLNAGTHNRVGPHRIYVKMARRLTELGFTCLRIDLPGVGDSEGEIRSIYFDMHDAADAVGAVDFLTRDHVDPMDRVKRVERVAIVAICGGARCALRLAAGDERVHGLSVWGLPIASVPHNLPAPQLEGDATSSPSTVTGTALRYLALHWIKKGFSPQAWKDYLGSGRTVGGALGNAARVTGRFLKRGFGRRVQAEIDFFSAIHSFLDSGRPAFFAYGENDAIPRQEFEANFRDIVEGRSRGREYAVIAGGDHTFTIPASEAEVMQRSLDWFDRTYPNEAGAAGPLSPQLRASGR